MKRALAVALLLMSFGSIALADGGGNAPPPSKPPKPVVLLADGGGNAPPPSPNVTKPPRPSLAL